MAAAGGSNGVVLTVHLSGHTFIRLDALYLSLESCCSACHFILQRALGVVVWLVSFGYGDAGLKLLPGEFA